MQFNGEWMRCEDGVIRPVMRAEIRTSGNAWRSFELLVDTGADRTVICASVLEDLQLPRLTSENQIGGIGGLARAVIVATTIRMFRDDGVDAVFRSEYMACLDHESLDMSVLGRDILDMFALVADRPRNILAILGGKHGYAIEQRQ
ncbi:MAG: aspartyl protease family protein [Pirellulaceae bacterium]